MHLGPDFVVWDKSAAIRYRKPGREALTAVFVLVDAEVAAIREEIDRHGSCERVFTTQFCDPGGVVHTEVDKTVYIACKQHYKAKTAR